MSLFQNSVQQKYLNMLDAKLVDAKYTEFKAYFGNPEIQQSKKALEIKTKIEPTDQEIDKMVYALYELTEEEI